MQDGALLLLASSSAKTLYAALTNAGTAQLTGGGNVAVRALEGAGIENAGLWDIQSTEDLLGYSSPVFHNTGIVRKSAGGTTARLGVTGSQPVALGNLGRVESLGGILQVFSHGLLTGEYFTGVGARVDFVSGTWTQPTVGQPTISGAGATRLASGTIELLDQIPNLELAGGTVVLLPSFQGGTITNLTLAGATLAGANVVTGTLNCGPATGPLTGAPGGMVNWASGSFAGPVRVESNASLRLVGTATKSLNGTLTNLGTVQLTGGGNLGVYAVNGGRIENAGRFEIRSTGDVPGYNSPVFRNTGIVRKSAGNSTARTGVSGSQPVMFENSGVVDVVFGTLSLFGSYTLNHGESRCAIRGPGTFGRPAFASAVSLAGDLGAYLADGYTPSVGARFALVTFPSASGVFANLHLPEGIAWQPEYAPGNFSIIAGGAVAGPGYLTIARGSQGPQVSWTNATALLLSATNAQGPWATNLGATSPFVVTNQTPQMFFRLPSP